MNWRCFLPFAFGYKLPPSFRQVREQAWGGMPNKVRRTHEANRWRLRIVRRNERRRSA